MNDVRPIAEYHTIHRTIISSNMHKINNDHLDAMHIIIKWAIEHIVASAWATNNIAGGPDELRARLQEYFNIANAPTKFQLPYIHSTTRDDICHGIEYNKGLYTQCGGKWYKNNYCKRCFLDAEKRDDKTPICGNIERRATYDVDKYEDMAGRTVKNYAHILSRGTVTLKDIARTLTRLGGYDTYIEQIEDKMKIVPRGTRGRPRKSDSVVIVDDDDLFMQMLESGNVPA